MAGVVTAVNRLGKWFNRRTLLGTGVAGLAAVSVAKAAEAKSIDVVKAIILAWRGLDVEGVMKYLADDIVWYSHVGGAAPLVGKAACRAFVVALGKRITDNKWRVFNMAANGNSVFCEGVDDFTATDGKQITVPYMGIMTVRNGLVVAWRDYFDGAMVDRMKRGEFDFAKDPSGPLMTRKPLF